MKPSRSAGDDEGTFIVDILGGSRAAIDRATSVERRLIAATAIELEAELATTDVRRYPMLPDLQPPYETA